MWTNVQEIESAIQNFASTYPTLAERIVLPELTWGDGAASPPRTVSALRIGVNAADGADGALFLFGHHAREWIPPEVALELAASLLGAYTGGTGIVYGGKSYSSADVQRIVNTINVFIVPCVNPDGRQFSLDHDVMSLTGGWRKNRNPNVHPTCIGVDCNRNYDFVFDLTKYFDLSNAAVTTYTSTNPCDSNQVYQGPSAFSEPETRNVRWLLETYGRIRWLIDVHGYTFDGEIYYPWGDDENQSTDPAKNWRNPAFDHQRGRKADAYSEYLRAEDLASHVYLADQLRDGIQPVNGHTYSVGQSYALYPTAGTSDDYAWSRHLVSPSLPRVESFAIEHRGSGFHTTNAVEQDEVIQELASGLINFSLACAGGIPGLVVALRTSTVVFNHCPEGRVSSRPVILQVTGADAASFRVILGPSRTGGWASITFGVAVGSQSVPASASPVTRDIYLWLTCAGGLAGNTATGTVRVECPEASFVADVPITADFVAVPRAGAVLALDRSGSMQEDGGDGRTRLQVLMDSAPGFVDAAPQGARLGLVRFATDESPGAPMSTMGPEGADPGGRDVIRAAINSHTIATGDAAWTSIGDGVYAGAALLEPEIGVDFKSLVVLTDGFENRPRFLSEVSGLITDRVFAIGLGTPEQIQPVALQTLTHGTNGYLLMTGTLDADDPFRLAKYYLQILTGVTNDQVVLDPGGWLPYGGTESIPFYLNEADAAVDAIVLMPVPALVRVRLRAPSGQIFDQSHPSMQWISGTRLGYYRYTLPVPGPWMAEGPGRWDILLDWKRKAAASWEKVRKALANAAGVSPKAIRYDALVHARSDLEMTTTVTQDRYTPGARVNLRVLLMQYASVALDGAQVTAKIEYPDGAISTQVLAGQGGGLYESNLTAALNGIYRIRITAQGKSLRGFAFTREAVRTAIVWRGGDAPPPTRQDDGWCSVLRCLVESKAVSLEVLRRLGIDIQELRRCCEGLERIAGSPKAVPPKTRLKNKRGRRG
jgi:hypothetical protein